MVDEESNPQSEEEVLHHEKMQEERSKSKNPIKKAARKTKLRKTMVF